MAKRLRDGVRRKHEQVARDRLIRLGGPSLVNELTSIFLEDMPRRLAAARIAIRSRDAAALAEVSHAMKSSCGQLGAIDLAAACERVELTAELGDLGRAAAALPDVEAEHAAFASWLREQASAARSIVEVSHTSRAPRPDAEVATVAIIEDNVDNRLLLNAILADEFVIAEYSGGPEALAGMRRGAPDVVLLDVSLPGMDGLEVLTQMRRDPALRRVPVIAVTAHAMTGDRERYLEAGFDGYVPKPIVDDEALLNTVRRLLSGRSASEQNP